MGVGEMGQIIGETGVGETGVCEMGVIRESMFKLIIQKANDRLKGCFFFSENLHSKKLLVMSLIQCHFDYACSFWYPGLSQGNSCGIGSKLPKIK